ncbi:MAG: MFS transporter [Anaerolineaceae bacterium]
MPQTATDAARRNVRLYYAFIFLMDFGLWSGIWIKYLTVGQGFELKWVLAMDLPFFLLVAFLNPPLGALADHIGRKKVLAIGALAFSATILGLGFTSNYWLLFCDYVLWAFAIAMRSGADQALIYDSLKEAGQEASFSRIAGRGFAVTLTAGVAGVIIGGFVAAQTSLAFTVQISALGPLAAMMVALTMWEPRVTHAERRYWRNLRTGMSFAWTHPQIRYAMLFGSVLLTAGFVPVVLIQPFLIDYDVPTSLYGVYQAPLRIISVVAAMVAFRLAARAGVPRMFLMGSAGMVIAYASIALIDARAAFAFFAIPSLVHGLVRPTLDTYINQRTPSERRATVLSVLSLFLSLELAFFEPILGFIVDGISIQAAMAVSATTFLVALPPLFWLWRREHHRFGGVLGGADSPSEAVAGR